MFTIVLTEDTAAFNIVSLETMKAQMSVTHAEFDTRIQSDLNTAIEKARGYTGRQFYPATLVDNYSGWGEAYLLERGPVTEVTTIKYYAYGSTELITVNSSNYIVVNRGLEREIIFNDNFSFPALANRPDAVQIAYSSGFEAADKIPESIKSAIILYCKDLFYHGNRVEIKISAADNLLRPYRCRR